MGRNPQESMQIAAARAYETLFVPALFAQLAVKVANVAQGRPGQRVLDVACGTGVLAREMAARVGATGRVVGIDINAGMLAIAGELATGIDWRAGTAEALPFGDATFDIVTCQFGLMFFADRREALREMSRVLAPSGRLVIAVWDTLDSMPAFADEVALIDRMAGTRAADGLRAPFALGDRTQLERLFADAGARHIELTTVASVACFPSIRVLVEADLRGWLPMLGVELDEDQIARILDAAQVELQDYLDPAGRAVFPVSAHIVTVHGSG